jgi:hypothetical protein
MYPGKPCHFLQIGVGCTIYDERPADPCKGYLCGWMKDLDIPDFMKPEIANCILDYRSDDGFEYLHLSPCEIPYTAKTLSWCLNYARSKNINFSWYLEGELYFTGNQDFIDAMNKKLKPL